MKNDMLIEKLVSAIDSCACQKAEFPGAFDDYYDGQIQAYRNVIRTLDSEHEYGANAVVLR